MHHVMIDLETLGTSPGCSILSVGACEFWSAEEPYGAPARFQAAAIRRQTCIDAGLKEDAATIGWWSMQDGGFKFLERCRLGPDALPLGDALHQLAFWLQQVSPLDKDLLVWGNGADFDLPILAEAYRRCGLRQPWRPYAGRCYRTLKNLRPDIKLVRAGAHHNALDDATCQAEHAARLLTELGGW
jgi:hypothetical protein